MSEERSKKCEAFWQQIKDMMDGKSLIPNEEEMDLGRAVSNASLAWGNVVLSKSRLMANGHQEWAIYFLAMTQGGQYDGSGMILSYGGGKGRAVTFRLCKHEKVVGAGANPRRGWHPGYCKHCGLDMTVDSGD